MREAEESMVAASAKSCVARVSIGQRIGFKLGIGLKRKSKFSSESGSQKKKKWGGAAVLSFQLNP